MVWRLDCSKVMYPVEWHYRIGESEEVEQAVIATACSSPYGDLSITAKVVWDIRSNLGAGRRFNFCHSLQVTASADLPPIETMQWMRFWGYPERAFRRDTELIAQLNPGWRRGVTQKLGSPNNRTNTDRIARWQERKLISLCDALL